jgi:N-acetyl sugar amidotransferase
MCSKTVMDTTDPDIVFDDEMISNHFYNYQNNVKSRIEVGIQADLELRKIIEKIKRSGKNKQYDCIVGVSGGTDSTFVAYKCKELGLRPLAVHFDNGWNSELAVSNIEKVLNQLDIDLYTYVIDWKEFSDLQLSFLKSSTSDIEIPTDHAIFALLYKVASKYKVKYVMNGMNFRTESIMPFSWAYGHIDWKYIKSVHKKFSNVKLKTYPHFSFFDLFYYTIVLRIKFVSILNYLDFNKADAQKLLSDQLGWKDYGGKHHESVYTKIVQTYILPKKFNIDKRKAHLSNLILCGQITRQHALEILETPPFEEQKSRDDIEYLTKKLRLSLEEFSDIMSSPNKTFMDYPNNFKIYLVVKKIQKFLREYKLFHK